MVARVPENGRMGYAIRRDAAFGIGRAIAHGFPARLRKGERGGNVEPRLTKPRTIELGNFMYVECMHSSSIGRCRVMSAESDRWPNSQLDGIWRY